MKPCPLCDGSDLETKRECTDWILRCMHPDCRCEVRAQALPDCIRRWNRRPPSPRLPLLWEHRQDKAPIGHIEVTSRGSLLVTFFAPIVRDVFFAMFPGAAAHVLEYHEARTKSVVWVSKVEIVEYSLLALQPPGRMLWMPIETAPRDGSDVIVGYEVASTWIVRSAWWRDEDEDEDDGDPAGWWSYRSSVTQEMLDDDRQPTHWLCVVDAEHQN